MTLPEAKQLLLEWRPGRTPEDAARLREALDLEQRDPELKVWLERHRAVQERITASLRSMPVPADLRESILRRAAERAVVRPRIWWQHPAAWSAAAALIFFIGLTFWPKPEAAQATLEVFRSRMVGAVLRQYTMDIVTNDMREVRSFLASRQAPADYVLPEKLGRLSVSGGGVLSWQGGKVSMVCLESLQRDTLFLFVVDAKSFTSDVTVARDFADVNRLATVTWTERGRTYVLAGNGGRAALEQYF